MRKNKNEKNKLIKSILKKDELTRDDAAYIIKTGMNLTVAKFSEKFGMPYRHLSESLVALRPFSAETQIKILEIARKFFKN